MSALEALRAGRLDDARDHLQLEVRRHPADAKLRVFLFQLLCIQGEWDRALTQLNVAGELDDGNLHMMHAYREALQCEALREGIFRGRHSPVVFGDPEPWIGQLVESLRLDLIGDFERARKARHQALEAAPAGSGSINGEAFNWIADADSRLGPVLEVLVNGRYLWVPFTRIKSLRVEAPSDLRDSVWMAAQFTWSNGGQAAGFIPTRYAGTVDSDEDALLLARKTSWQEPAPGMFFGRGQRMLATDCGDYALMDIRRIDFDIALPAGDGESAEEAAEAAAEAAAAGNSADSSDAA